MEKMNSFHYSLMTKKQETNLYLVLIQSKYLKNVLWLLLLIKVMIVSKDI